MAEQEQLFLEGLLEIVKSNWQDNTDLHTRTNMLVSAQRLMDQHDPHNDYLDGVVLDPNCMFIVKFKDGRTLETTVQKRAVTFDEIATEY